MTTENVIKVNLGDDLRRLSQEIKRQMIGNVGKADAAKIKEDDLNLMVAVLAKLGIADDSITKLLAEGLFEDLPNLLAECSRYSVMDYFESFKIHQQQAKILATKLRHPQMIADAVQAVINIDSFFENLLSKKKKKVNSEGNADHQGEIEIDFPLAMA